MESLHQRLGPQAMMDDLADLDAEGTPQYDQYEDKLQDNEIFPSLDEETKVAPE